MEISLSSGINPFNIFALSHSLDWPKDDRKLFIEKIDKILDNSECFAQPDSGECFQEEFGFETKLNRTIR
jgi:hypothetical protein